MGAPTINNTHNRQTEILNWNLKQIFTNSAPHINTSAALWRSLFKHLLELAAQLFLFLSLFSRRTFSSFLRQTMPSFSCGQCLHNFRTSQRPAALSLKCVRVCKVHQRENFPQNFHRNVFTCWIEEKKKQPKKTCFWLVTPTEASL